MSQVRSHFVRQMVRKILAESKIKAPPVDLLRILTAHGIAYEEVDDFPDTVDALFIEDDGRAYAAVNARQHLHRRRFSLAHELGHYFLHRKRFRESLSKEHGHQPGAAAVACPESRGVTI